MLKNTCKNMVNSRYTNVDIFDEYITDSNILFHRFDEPDKKIDGIVEVIKNEKTLNIQYGIKIFEIGEQLQDPSNITIDISCDVEYFNNFQLPLFFIVLDNTTEEGYWMDITSAKGSLSPNIIIRKDKHTIFNKTTSSNILIDYFINKRFKFTELVEQIDTLYFKNLRSLLQDMFGIIDIAIPIILKYKDLETIIKEESFTLHLTKASEDYYSDVMSTMKSEEYLYAESLPNISKTKSTINLSGGTPFYFKTRSNHLFMTDRNFEYYKSLYRIFKFRFD